MGASESALIGSDALRQVHRKGVTCIAAAAETQQKILHIPLLCGAITSVDFSTVLGEGSYGVVYSGSVDRRTCKYCPTDESRLSSGSFDYTERDALEDSGQSSTCPRQGCQYCFSDRTRQVAVKALRHTSQRQQRFFINRFKFLQLIRLQQLLHRSQQGARPSQDPALTDEESATSASSKEEERKSFSHASKSEKVQKVAVAADESVSGIAADVGPVAAQGGPRGDDGSSCSCCRFLQFPSFDSLHLLQVFGVYACSRVSREYLVMEKLSGPTLFNYLCNKYSDMLPKEWEACQIVVPILKGLGCIHEEGFIHGDIKLENIMFRSSVPHPSTLTLVDLDGLTPLPSAAAKAARAYSVAASAAKHPAGWEAPTSAYPLKSSAFSSSLAAAAAAAACNTSLSSLLSGEGNTLEGLCCTPQYLPVEVVRERKISPFADLHAVGCICYLLMEGCFPHERINLKSQGILSSGHICQKLARDVRYPRVKQKYSPLCENFMRKLLSSDPKYRFGSAQEALAHPWIEYARTLQTPEEVEQERKLLRSVLKAAEEAAERAVEAADRAAAAAREQAEAEAAAAAAAAIAAEAAALEAAAALRAAQEAAAAAAAAAKKAEADRKAKQAAAAASAARAEKAKAEQAAEESAAAVVALAQCQVSGGLETTDKELQLLLSPRTSAGRQSGEGSTNLCTLSGAGTSREPYKDLSGAVTASERRVSAHEAANRTPRDSRTGDWTMIGIQRDESFCRDAARFVAASRMPRTPRGRAKPALRASDPLCEQGAAQESSSDTSAFVLLNQQQREFAKRGAAAAAARPSISGAVRALDLVEQQGIPNLVLPPARLSVEAPPVAGCNSRGSDSGERSVALTATAHKNPNSACVEPPLQSRRPCADSLGLHQPHQHQGRPLGEEHEGLLELNRNKDGDIFQTPQPGHSQRSKSRRTPSIQQEGDKESPPSWYNGIVNFLEVVTLQSPRRNIQMS